MMNEKLKRIIAVTLLIAGTLVLAVRRFTMPHNYPDSLKYARYVDIFLGRDFIAEPIPAPFIYRPLVPLIASLPSLFVDSITGLSITNMGFAALWVVILYHICLEIVPDDLTAFIVSGAALATPIAWNYAGSPLVDVPAMCFVGAVVLLALRGQSPYAVTVLVLFGSLAKELVLFAGVFYLLYCRNKISVLPLFSSASVTLLVRLAVADSVTQPLALHELQPWFLSHTVQTLGAVGLISLFGLLALNSLDTNTRNTAIQLLVTGLLAFVPYMLLGAFNAYYGPRFAWPVQLALVPLACVGAKYVLDSLLGKHQEKESESHDSAISGPLDESTYSDKASDREPSGESSAV